MDSCKNIITLLGSRGETPRELIQAQTVPPVETQRPSKHRFPSGAYRNIAQQAERLTSDVPGSSPGVPTDVAATSPTIHGVWVELAGAEMANRCV